MYTYEEENNIIVLTSQRRQILKTKQQKWHKSNPFSENVKASHKNHKFSALSFVKK
jgi:hypothetical protein